MYINNYAHLVRSHLYYIYTPPLAPPAGYLAQSRSGARPVPPPGSCFAPDPGRVNSWRFHQQ